MQICPFKSRKYSDSIQIRISHLKTKKTVRRICCTENLQRQFSQLPELKWMSAGLTVGKVLDTTLNLFLLSGIKRTGIRTAQISADSSDHRNSV